MADLTPEQQAQLQQQMQDASRRRHEQTGTLTPEQQAQLQQQMQDASRRRHEQTGTPYPHDASGRGPNNLEVIGGFNDRNTGRDVSKYEGLEFKDGNFKMPKPLLDAAKLMAQELITIANEQGVDLSKSPQWKDAGLLTKDRQVNVDSLSAYLLAKSMGNNTASFIDSPFAANRKDSLTATFDNKLGKEDYKADPKLVFEMARQIMGDNGMHNVIGAPTNTAEADAQFVSNNAKSATTTLTAKC